MHAKQIVGHLNKRAKAWANYSALYKERVNKNYDGFDLVAQALKDEAKKVLANA